VARHQGRAGNSGDPRDSSKTGVGQYNRHTGRTLDGPLEVGCPHTSEDAGAPAEQRGAHGSADSRATSATHRGGTTATTGVESIARRVRREPGATCTALMHHGGSYAGFQVHIAINTGGVFLTRPHRPLFGLRLDDEGAEAVVERSRTSTSHEPCNRRLVPLATDSRTVA
jgi:hypothetical protein